MPKLSIIIPSRDEEGAIKPLLSKIRDALMPYTPELKYEAIVVDDSTDKTAMIAKACGARVIKGRGKGLGQAIIDGINASEGDIVVVIDADGQHNPQDIPRLIKPIIKQGQDFVIGSKYCKGGDVSEWGLFRRIISTVSGCFWFPFFGVRDVNSGFFAFRKSILDGVELKPDSWKIMLEVLVKANWASKLEIPIKFGRRIGGISKNSIKQSAILTVHMIKLLLYKYRFLKFGLVGAIFAGYHFGVLYALTEFVGFHYLSSVVISEVTTATMCYTLNHFWTFQRTKIRHGWFLGWVEYIAVDSLAMVAYLGMIVFFTEVLHIWYIVSAAMAVSINYPIKYMVFSKLIWKDKAKDSSDSKDFEWRAFYRANPLRKAWKRAITDRVASFVNSQPNGTMLEFGCGSSPTIAFLNHRHYVGIDRNKGKIEYMRGKGLPDCEFVVGDKNTLNAYENKSFDTVLCVEVLEHLAQPAEVIQMLSDKLKVGGKLVIATPNRKSLFWQILEKVQRIVQPAYHTSQHIRLFSEDDVNAMCFANGLRNIKTDHVALGMDMVLCYERV